MNCTREWYHVGTGRNRSVWRVGARGRFVVKVPLNWQGEYDNECEHRTYRRYRNQNTEIKFAACRLLPNGWLLMEYVEDVPVKQRPKWADFVDCGQVGRTIDGRIVAYDFGRY